MNLNDLVTLTYWNTLARSHLAELVMILTAALIALADRYIRRMLAKATSSSNAVTRFLLFLLVCSVGYGLLALGLAQVLRQGLYPCWINIGGCPQVTPASLHQFAGNQPFGFILDQS